MPSLILSMVLTFIGSVWIDLLFERNRKILSYPEKIKHRSRFRKIFLLAMFFLCINLVYNLQTVEFFYSLTAIFFLLLITVTDSEQYVIFDRMLIIFLVIGLISIFDLNLNFTERILSSLIGAIIFTLLAVITRGGIGGGDIKLIAVLGIWFGIDLIDVVSYGFILGGIFAVILIALKIKQRTNFFAYGIYFSMTALYFLVN